MVEYSSIMNVPISFNYENHIVLDDFNTWPQHIVDYIKKYTKELREFIREESRIDKLAETDILLRINRPANPHEDFWKHSLSSIRESIKHLNIVGFHCSRLVETEIDEIRRDGLQPLSNEFALKRIKNVQRLGFMEHKTADILIKNNKTNDPSRKGKIAFFDCISTLQDESGLHRLLRSWGGEAIYWCHENNADMMSVLQNIGIPCIVVSSLHISEISCLPAIEERIVNIWLNKNNPDASSQDHDTFIERTVSALEVITRDDQRFEHLTRCSSWYYTI